MRRRRRRSNGGGRSYEEMVIWEMLEEGWRYIVCCESILPVIMTQLVCYINEREDKRGEGEIEGT